MPLTTGLKARCQDLCELCNTNEATIAYAVSPKNNDTIENEVALCSVCMDALDSREADLHWNCLAGSIWNTEPAVQALSYRVLYNNRDKEWASDLISSAVLDESTINWALTAFEKPEVHKDGNGNILETGDTVVLTQSLNVKGANFNAPKGTVVRKIRLVPDNTEQIEGKINDQVIVILAKYTRKS